MFRVNWGIEKVVEKNELRELVENACCIEFVHKRGGIRGVFKGII